MKNLLSLLLLISIISLTSCSKDNDSEGPLTLKGVQTGDYLGLFSFGVNLAYPSTEEYKDLGGKNEKVILKHTSGNIYTVDPVNEDLPSVKLEFKKSGEGYGIYVIENQKCKYGNFVPVPMTSFGIAYSGVYNPSIKTLNLGYYNDYYPTYIEIIQMGGIVIKTDEGKINGYIQINITKK